MLFPSLLSFASSRIAGMGSKSAKMIIRANKIDPLAFATYV
jgi:hypothetical protein